MSRTIFQRISVVIYQYISACLSQTTGQITVGPNKSSISSPSSCNIYISRPTQIITDPLRVSMLIVGRSSHIILGFRSGLSASVTRGRDHIQGYLSSHNRIWDKISHLIPYVKLYTCGILSHLCTTPFHILLPVWEHYLLLSTTIGVWYIHRRRHGCTIRIPNFHISVRSPGTVPWYSPLVKYLSCLTQTSPRYRSNRLAPII